MATTKYIVDNQAGQTIEGEPILKPYKIYTSLVTQSGGNDNYDQSSEDLLIGRTYLIDNNDGNADWTNVGAPNNNLGTYFVATGTTPNAWGNGTLQYNTGAPVVTVLENTIGNIWFTYNSTGQYYINSNGLFTINKTISYISPNFVYESFDLPYITHTNVSANEDIIVLKSFDNITPSNNIIGFIGQYYLEIRVYN